MSSDGVSAVTVTVWGKSNFVGEKSKTVGKICIIWPCPVAAARYGAAAAGAAQLEVFRTARTRQCFGESNPAWDRDSRLYIGPPARWPCPVAAARYCAAAAGAAQLEVFLTGTARMRQCFGESYSARDCDPADCILARRPDGPVLWQRPCTVQQQRGPPNMKSF